MKAYLSTAIALAFIVSMAACTSRKDGTPSSSVAPSSSMTSSIASAPSSNPASSEGLTSRIEDSVSNAMSDVASVVTPTMSTDLNKIGALNSALVKWGPGVQVDQKNRTTGSIQMQEQYGKYGAYFIAPEDCGKFYLTFDEGYENGFTPAILDVLKEKEVSAVFFVTMPFVKSEPELIQRMIDEGHVIGNHTNRHLNPTQVSIEEAHRDIQELHDYMLENFDYEMNLYRPPEGVFSEQVLGMVQSLGYTTVLWSFAYADWDPNQQMAQQDALAKTTKMIHDGGIYLLHAVSKTNTEILGSLIDEIRAQDIELSKWDLPYVAAEE